MVMSSPNSQQMLDELRRILLSEDRQSNQGLIARFEEMERMLKEEDFEGKLEPHLEAHISYLQENFPELFGKHLATAIKVQIRDSQNEIIDALYPIIGKLIVRFLRAEIERISQQIDDRLKDPFSFESIKLRFKALFSGVSYEELLLQSTVQPEVEELFIIQAETGLPLGHFSLHQVTHPDMVAGMLTGIKSFMEHAFEKGEQELHTMEYDQNEILLYSYQTFYVAAVVAGQAKATFKQQLHKKINEFCELYPITIEEPISQHFQEDLSAKLNAHFHGFN